MAAEKNNELELLLKTAKELEELKPGAIFVLNSCASTMLASERMKEKEELAVK